MKLRNGKNSVVTPIVKEIIMYKKTKCIQREIHYDQHGHIHNDDNKPAIREFYPSKRLKCQIWYDHGRFYRNNDLPSYETYYDNEENSTKRQEWRGSRERFYEESDKPTVRCFYPNKVLQEEIYTNCWYWMGRKEKLLPSWYTFHPNGAVNLLLWVSGTTYHNNVFFQPNGAFSFPNYIQFDDQGKILEMKTLYGIFKSEDITKTREVHRDSKYFELWNVCTLTSNADAFCAICHNGEEGERARLVLRTECGHDFHFMCLTDWIFNQTNCPMCRHEFKK